MAETAGYLKSLKSESVVQRVINCLTEAMVSKQLRPGDRLPTEPELAATLGVARTSIREATKILTYLGVLESKRSEGTFVANGFQESMIDPMVYGVILGQGDSTENLIELREMIEVGILQLAIQKRDDAGLAQLEERLAAMQGFAEQGGDILEGLFRADDAFHDAVAALCRNPLADKINRVARVLTYAMRRDTVQAMITTNRLEEFIQAHREICQVLRSRNTEHLNEIIHNTYFLGVIEEH